MTLKPKRQELPKDLAESFYFQKQTPSQIRKKKKRSSHTLSLAVICSVTVHPPPRHLPETSDCNRLPDGTSRFQHRHPCPLSSSLTAAYSLFDHPKSLSFFSSPKLGCWTASRTFTFRNPLLFSIALRVLLLPF